MTDRIVAETRFLRLRDRNGWFFVQRPNCSGVVTIVAITPSRRLLFVEQFRPPLGGNSIELPAGLMGDEPGHEQEDPLASARRELLEETGYRAGALELFATTVTSPGMTDERVHFVLAWDLEKVGPGGGVASENITVHEIPIADARAWLRSCEASGLAVAAKAYAGLLFARERWG